MGQKAAKKHQLEAFQDDELSLHAADLAAISRD
jgi:hypothetical protein